MHKNKKLIEFLSKAQPPPDLSPLEDFPRHRLIGAAMIILMCQKTEAQNAVRTLQKLDVDNSEIKTAFKEIASYFASLN